MSKLDELINKLCPDGVEYKKIEDFIDYIQPSKYIVKSTEYDDSFETPVLTAGQTFILGYTDEIDGIFKASKENPVIIFDDFTAGFHWVDFDFKVKSSAMKILISKNTINFRYFFHVMGKLNIHSTEHTRLWIGTYSQFEIPVPPLEIQNEIVRILDNFTELEEELEEELEARRKQYEYYRDSLLSFDDNTTWKNFEDVVRFINGRAYKQEELLQKGKYKVLRVGNFFTNNSWYYSDLELDDDKYCNKGDLLYAWAASLGPKIWDGDKTIYHYHIWKLEFDENVIFKKYLYHFLKYDVDKMYESLTHSTMPHVSMGSMQKRRIPIPPLEEQKRIVSILDRFENISNDISSGLPAEIEARHKQYEYYRDKLLTFKRKSA